MTFENPLDQQNTPLPFKQDNPFSPKGRFGRLSYIAWLFITSMLYSCALFIVFGVAAVALLKSGAGFDPTLLMTTGLGIFTIILFIAVIIIFTVVSVCLCIRRLHDLNKSGWLWLLFLIPIVNIIFGIYIFVAKGTDGPNNYGPKRPTEQTEKLLGIVYSVFLAIFIVAYGGIIAWAYSMQGQLPYSQMQSYEHDMEEMSEASPVQSEEIPAEADTEETTQEEHAAEESHDTVEINTERPATTQ